MAEKCCRACEKLCAAAVRAPVSAGAPHASAGFLCDDRRSYPITLEGLRGIWDAPSSQERGREKRVWRSVNHFISVWCKTVTA